MTTLQVKFCHDLSLEKPQYRGLSHGVKLIVREHGLGGLYQVQGFSRTRDIVGMFRMMLLTAHAGILPYCVQDRCEHGSPVYFV